MLTFMRIEYGFKEFQKENPYGGTPIFDVGFGVSGSDNRFNLIGVNPAESELNVIISLDKLDIHTELLIKNASLEDYQIRAKTLSSTAGIVLKLLKVLGVPLGYLASYSMIIPSSQYYGMLMSLPVKVSTILTCLLFLLGSYVIATFLSGRKFNKVDMVESLKCPLE